MLELPEPSELSVRTGQTELRKVCSAISWMGPLVSCSELKKSFPACLFKVKRVINVHSSRIKVIIVN